MGTSGLHKISEGEELDRLASKLKKKHPGQAKKVEALADRKIATGIRQLGRRPPRRKRTAMLR